MTATRGFFLAIVVTLIAHSAHADTVSPYKNLFQIAPVDFSGEPPSSGLPPVGRDDTSIPSRDLAPVLFEQQPAEPEHTGFRALVSNIGGDFKAFPRRRSTWVILGIGAGAAALAHPADDSLNARMTGSAAVGRFFAPGKWIGSAYVQVGAAVGVYLVGRYAVRRAPGESRTNKVSHLGLDLIRAAVVSQAFTQAIKYTARRDRPTGECCAFPSGHASSSFAAASVLERPLGYRGAWPTLVIASYVAASRLHDNRHFLSDVVFGSALGIATGWTVVGRHGRSDYSMAPVPTRGGVMIAFFRTPKEDR